MSPASPRIPGERTAAGDTGRQHKAGIGGAIGLGIIIGAADDDPSAIGTYASAGAAIGTSFLWIPSAPEPHDDNLETIPWGEFFQIFDREKLAILFQEKTADGQGSRFFRFVEQN